MDTASNMQHCWQVFFFVAVLVTRVASSSGRPTKVLKNQHRAASIPGAGEVSACRERE
jgi:hypothetical protein